MTNVKRAPLPQWWWDQTVQTRRIIAAGVLAVLVALLCFGIWSIVSGDSSTGTEGVSTDSATDDTEAEARRFVASLPPERVATWDSLAECESGGDWGTATGNGYYGGLQLSQTSWIEAGGGEGSPHEASREEQIMRAETIYDAQGWSAWPSCSAQLGLSG